MHFSDPITGCLVVFIVITVGLVIKTQGDVVKVGTATDDLKRVLKISVDTVEGVQILDDGIVRINSEGVVDELFPRSSMESTLYFKEKLNS